MTGYLALIVTAIFAVLSACAPRVDVRGNLPDPDLLANIEVDHITKREVASLIGSPSTISPLTDETWYYVSERTESFAFFASKIKERKVVAIRFDQTGVAREIKIFGLEDARKIKMVERATPTAGKEFTLIRQLFGNIGRFEGDSELQK